MKKLRILLTLSILICLICNANANINELVEYEVYYNDQTATVFNADLKVGEPATIKAVVHLKKNVDVSTGLTATGFRDEDPNQPYKVIDGSSEFIESAREFGRNATETVTFEWVICPTDIAAGWTIPLNIDFTFYDRDEEEGYPIYFTVANICVPDEHSSGSATHTSDPSSTGQPYSESSPGFGILTVLLSMILMMLCMKRK